MMQILIISCLSAMAMAEAEPHGVYAHAVPALYNSYPNWPGVSGLGFSSTCYGCYGKKKRSAEPHGYGYPLVYGYAPYVHAHGPGVAGNPGGATSYVAGSGPGIGKRSADAEPHGVYGYGYHALPAYSVRGVSQLHTGGGHSFQHVALGKRSADAEPHGVYGYGYHALPAYSVRGVSQLHAGGGHSFQHVALGKRSADAEPHGVYGYGYHALPAYSVRGVHQLHAGGGHSFQHVALGKRSADAEPAFQNYGFPYALGHAVVPSTTYGIHQAHPGAGHSFQHVSRAHLWGR